MSDARSARATAERYVCAAGSMSAADVAAARAYRDVTAEELPWLIDELDGVAEGSGADPLAVFAASIEELESTGSGRRPLHRHGRVRRPPPPTVTCGWPTTTTWTGVEDDLVAIEWHVPGDPGGADLRHRSVDQRRLQLCRAGAHRERAFPQRQPGRHPAAAPGARHDAPPDGRPRRCRPRCTRAGRRRTTTCSATVTELS